MKKEITIGKIPKLSHLIRNLLIVIMIYGFFYMIEVSSLQSYMFPLLNISLLFIGVLLVLIMLLNYGAKQYFIIDHDKFRYYSYDGIFSQMKNMICLLSHKEMIPCIDLSIDSIESVSLLYSDVTTSFYFKGHGLIYCITLKDHTLIKIKPDSFNFMNPDIVAGIEFLKEHGVKIVDHYQLLDGLKNESMNFSDYVEQVVKKHERSL